MNVAKWAEIRRLSEVEKLSQRAIAQRVGCSRRTVARALGMEQAPLPGRQIQSRASGLDPFKPRIKAIIDQYPNLSAVRILEKISASDDQRPGYAGGITQLRSYLRSIRPNTGRVYQDIVYSPGEAVQIDWGDVGSIKINNMNKLCTSIFKLPGDSYRVIRIHLFLQWVTLHQAYTSAFF